MVEHAMHLAVGNHGENPRVPFFIESLLQMLSKQMISTETDAEHSSERAVPLPKDEIFFVCSFRKNCF